MITAGGSKHYTNPKKVTVNKKNVTLNAGGTFKIEAKVIKKNTKKKLLKKTIKVTVN